MLTFFDGIQSTNTNTQYEYMTRVQYASDSVHVAWNAAFIMIWKLENPGSSTLDIYGNNPLSKTSNILGFPMNEEF